ncbi:MAG: ATP synthase F1 subunit delta [Candidatus Eisenbacteria bacterium]
MIRDRGVALKYAHALFGAAEQRNVAEQVLADLQGVAELEKLGTSLQDFLESPSVLDEHKEQMVTSILRGKVHELVVQLLLLMLRKKRIGHYPLVLPHYQTLVEAKLGVLRAEVVTAIPIDAATLDSLRAGLEKSTGKKLRLEHRVDPSILGGVVATVGGEVIDSSVRHRLAELREELLASNVLS